MKLCQKWTRTSNFTNKFDSYHFLIWTRMDYFMHPESHTFIMDKE